MTKVVQVYLEPSPRDLNCETADVDACEYSGCGRQTNLLTAFQSCHKFAVEDRNHRRQELQAAVAVDEHVFGRVSSTVIRCKGCSLK